MRCHGSLGVLLAATLIGGVSAAHAAWDELIGLDLPGTWSAGFISEERHTDNYFTDGANDDPNGKHPEPEWITILQGTVRREGPKERLLPTLFEASMRGELHMRFPMADFYEYGTKGEWRIDNSRFALHYHGSPRKLSFIDESHDSQTGAVQLRRYATYRQNVWGADYGWKFLQPHPVLLNIGYDMDFRDFRPRYGEIKFLDEPFSKVKNLDEERSFVAYEPSLELVWRAVPWFRPFAGVEWERQTAKSTNRTKEGFRLSAGLFGEWNRLWWGFGFSERNWDYFQALGPRPDPQNPTQTLKAESNYQRHDRKREWSFELGMRVWQGLSARMLYEYTNAISTRPDRIYQVNDVTFGFLYEFTEGV